MTVENDLESSFPKGIAEGPAFCNREQERARLIQNIKTAQHTLVISPRRYGKTSLIKYAMRESAIAFGQADIFVAIDAERIEQAIIAGVRAILHQIKSPIEQLMKMLTEYFQAMNSEWVVGIKSLNLYLSAPKNMKDPAQNIAAILLALETVLEKKHQKAVLFIDEIQEIGLIAEGRGIEGAIRSVAQQTKNLVFIFSGSQQHLLTEMFSHRSRPLYKLCDRITLDRISQDKYITHLNKNARLRFGHNLPAETLQAIFTKTEYHSFYMNALCRMLWRHCKTTPTPQDVETLWLEMIHEAKVDMIEEVSSLSFGQRKVLLVLAFNPTAALTSKENLTALNLSSSTVVNSTQTLIKKDYIEKNTDGYRIIDPLLKSAMTLYYSND